MEALILLVGLGIGFVVGYKFYSLNAFTPSEMKISQLIKSGKLKVLKKRVPVPPEVEAVEELERTFTK